MHGVLTSLRDTIRRYGLTSQSITADATIGTKTVKVPMSRKFFEGETIVIRNDTHGEMRTIATIPDSETILLTENLVRTWSVAEGAIFEKAPGGQYIKRIYLGDPDVIPDYPAITIVADSRDEKWWTIGGSTIIDWNCTISCLFEDDGLENAYENMLLMTKTIEDALWANRKPIFGKLSESDLTADAVAGSTLLTVADTTGIMPGYEAVLEDYNRTQYIEIDYIIDANNVSLKHTINDNYLVSRAAKLIMPSRWTMWTKPSGTTYGYIHKGTLLKASQIKWFAQEEVVRLNTFIGATDL